MVNKVFVPLALLLICLVPYLARAGYEKEKMPVINGQVKAEKFLKTSREVIKRSEKNGEFETLADDILSFHKSCLTDNDNPPVPSLESLIETSAKIFAQNQAMRIFLSEKQKNATLGNEELEQYKRHLLPMTIKSLTAKVEEVRKK